MRTKVQLQRGTEIAAPTNQAPEFAIRVPSGAKTAYVYVNVYSAKTGGSYTFAFDTATSEALPLGTASPIVNLWVQVGGPLTLAPASNGGASGVVTITALADLLRWRATAAAGTFSFDAVVYFTDS